MIEIERMLDIKITIEEPNFKKFSVEGLSKRGEQFIWGTLDFHGLSAEFSRDSYEKLIDILEERKLSWGVVSLTTERS